MNRRILSAVIAVLGLVAIILAVCSATVWRPSAQAHAAMSAAPEQNYVVTRPGVLGLVDSAVTLNVTAQDPSSPVFVAVGHSADVQAWLANDPYVAVTGLEDWTVLSTETVTSVCNKPTEEATASAAAEASASASEAPSPAATSQAPSPEPTAEASSTSGCTELVSSGADPADSDLWLTTTEGTGQATLELSVNDPDLVAIVATTGAQPAPQLTLSWPRQVSTPWLVPGLVLGGLLLLVGIFLFLIDVQIRRADEQRRARAAARAAHLAQADSMDTVGLPQVNNDPNRSLTRREKRDKERAEASGEEWLDPRTGIVYVGGTEVPPVPQAPQDVQPVDEGDLSAGSTGAARGSAVVPGLDPQTTAAYRAERALPDDVPLSLVQEDGVPEQPAPESQDPEAPGEENGDAWQDRPQWDPTPQWEERPQWDPSTQWGDRLQWDPSTQPPPQDDGPASADPAPWQDPQTDQGPWNSPEEDS